LSPTQSYHVIAFFAQIRDENSSHGAVQHVAVQAHCWMQRRRRRNQRFLMTPEVGVVEIVEELPPIDPEEIVEEAEQLLREGRAARLRCAVIGGGPGGYVAAIRAAQLGAHVGLWKSVNWAASV
jgi:phosphoserine phosphatase